MAMAMEMEMEMGLEVGMEMEMGMEVGMEMEMGMEVGMEMGMEMMMVMTLLQCRMDTITSEVVNRSETNTSIGDEFPRQIRVSFTFRHVKYMNI